MVGEHLQPPLQPWWFPYFTNSEPKCTRLGMNQSSFLVDLRPGNCANEYGFEEDKSVSEDDDDGVRKTGGDIAQQAVLAQVAALAAASQQPPTSGVPISLPGILGMAGVAGGNDGAARAAALVAAMNLQHNLAQIQADSLPKHYEAKLEINDFPQNARWKVTHKETLGPIVEWTGAAITTRGQYIQPGRIRDLARKNYICSLNVLPNNLLNGPKPN
ncbi:putative RNA helicase [Helianthus annuus]|nr:putative RNA helicase [Helianthus annuus]